MKNWLLLAVVIACGPGPGRVAYAWDYEGHRLVNLLALGTLPDTYPKFILEPSATERIAFLSGEPDRWRNVQDLTFKHATGPDHYMDVEELVDYGLKPEGLPIFRADFIAQLALIRKQNPAKFPVVDASRNQDHTRELVGLLPWAMTESYSKLKASFSYLKAFENDGGTAEEIANAQANVIYTMGVMGHFFADAAQPLHTTIHHHGWVGENPQRYSTNRTIHSWIDGGYFAKVSLPKPEQLKTKLRAPTEVMLNGRPAKPDEMFQAMVSFVVEQNKLVEKLYQFEKEGRLSGNGLKGLEGKEFLEQQMVKSAQLLADVWLSAWQQAPADSFLRGQLAKRRR